MNYRDKLERVLPIVEELRQCGQGTLFLNLGNVELEDDVSISYFPPEASRADSVRCAIKHFGMMKKEANGNMYGERDGISITLFHVLECKIVGTKKVMEPVLIEQGYREVEKPVYDCRVPGLGSEVAS